MVYKTPLGYEEFLKPTYQCESDDPKIRKLAERITKNKKTAGDVAIALFEWVRDTIPWSIEKIIGARKILEREPKKAICIDKINLFIALCRSIGLPARYVLLDAEFNYKSPEIPRWTKHVAAEVFVNDKWVIVDPSFGKHTEKLMNISQFGRPSWINSKNMKRAKSLSRFFILFGNFLMNIAPFFKKLKKAIEETTY